MKKIFILALSAVLAASMLTGCGKSSSSQSSSVPQPTPSPSATPVLEDTSDPNYESVLAIWKDLSGFWTDKDNNLVYFYINDGGKAEMKMGLWESTYYLQGLGQSVTASNKTTYDLVIHCPKQSETSSEGPEGVIVQDERTLRWSVETSNLHDEYITVKDESGKETLYRFTGKTQEDALKNLEAVRKLFKSKA